MIIRDARTPDAARLAVLAAQLGYPATALEVEARLKKYEGKGDERVIVAEISGEVVGWTSAALIDEVRRWSAAKGVDCLRLRANVMREDAHRFYARYGFLKTKTQYVFELKLDKEGSR